MNSGNLVDQSVFEHCLLPFPLDLHSQCLLIFGFFTIEQQVPSLGAYLAQLASAEIAQERMSYSPVFWVRDLSGNWIWSWCGAGVEGVWVCVGVWVAGWAALGAVVVPWGKLDK